MYCSNCGASVEENSKFCTSCGSIIETIQKPATDPNPYATVANPAAQPVFYQSQPVDTFNQSAQAPTYGQSQAYNQPVNYIPTYGQPQYMRPVQTPDGVQYAPVSPVINKPTPAKYNPFVFVSAAISGVMLILCFMPWFTIGNKGYNLFDVFSFNIYLEQFELDSMAACSLIMIIAMGMLIPALILALVAKNKMPIGFSIAASAITLFTLFLFVVLISTCTGYASATVVPFAMFMLSIANIIFPIFARKK